MQFLIVCVAVVVALGSSATADVTMDWVTVGNPGNANDSTGYGGVSNAYRISTYEVTAGQYTDFLNAVAATDTHGLYNESMDSSSDGCQITQNGTSGNYTYDFSGRPSGTEADWSNRPVNFVSWYDTLRFSNWLHNGQGAGDTEDGAYDMSLGSSVVRKAGAQVFLPTENEWYKAAYHKNDGVTGNYFDYPTSSDSTPGRDMSETTNPDNNANYHDSDYLIGSPYYRTEVGEFELSDSPYGTFDMGGNVSEWNEALIGMDRGARGGAYYDGSIYLHSTRQLIGGPHYKGSNLGFRVSSVPEPATLSLLVIGGLAMLRRKK